MTGPGRVLLAEPGRRARKRLHPFRAVAGRSAGYRVFRLGCGSGLTDAQQLRQLACAGAAVEALAPFGCEAALAQAVGLPRGHGLGERGRDRRARRRDRRSRPTRCRAEASPHRPRAARARGSGAPRPRTRRPCPRRPRGRARRRAGRAAAGRRQRACAASASACGRKPSSASASPRPRPSAHSRSAGRRSPRNGSLEAAMQLGPLTQQAPRARPGTAAACARRRERPRARCAWRSPRA